MLCDWNEVFNPTPEQKKYYEDEYKKLLQSAYDEHKCFTCRHFISDEPERDFIQPCPTCEITGHAAITTCDRYESDDKEEIH